MEQKILVVSPFFYPEVISTGKYNTRMAESLRDLGHEVEVLCSHPLYPEWRPEATDKEVNGVKIRRGGLGVRYPRSAVLRRLFLEVWFALYVFDAIKKTKKSYTRIIFIHPPNLAALVATRLLMSEKTTSVGIVHDVQGILVNSQVGGFRRLISWVVRKLEGAALESMDKLIFLSENMRESANVIYPGLSPESDVVYPFVSIDRQASSDKDYFANDRLNIVYSGALAEKQNPEGLLRLFESLSQDDRFCCHIFSAGREFERLKLRSNSSHLEFHSLVPEEELANVICSSSLQVVPQVLSTSDGAFPSKIPNIISFNTPLLCITPESSELHKLLHSSGRALLCNHWNVDVIKESVVRFLLEGGVTSSYKANLIKEFDVQKLAKKII